MFVNRKKVYSQGTPRQERKTLGMRAIKQGWNHQDRHYDDKIHTFLFPLEADIAKGTSQQAESFLHFIVACVHGVNFIFLLKF